MSVLELAGFSLGNERYSRVFFWVLVGDFSEGILVQFGGKGASCWRASFVEGYFCVRKEFEGKEGAIVWRRDL